MGYSSVIGCGPSAPAGPGPIRGGGGPGAEDTLGLTGRDGARKKPLESTVPSKVDWWLGAECKH